MVTPTLFGLMKSQVAPEILKFVWGVTILEVVSKEGLRWLWSDETDRALGLALDMMDSDSEPESTYPEYTGDP